MERQIQTTTQLDNLSLVLHKKGDLRLEQTPIPDKLDPYECLLETHSCGICGSDLHLWHDGYLDNLHVEKPYVIGHETSATVVSVGDSVTKLKPGDRVAIEPVIPCLRCEYCRAGRYHLCVDSNVIMRGLPHHNGCLRRYYAHHSEFCHKLPDNVSMEEGALLEPMAVAVHGIRRVSVKPGENVLVCGAGTMGMLSFLTAKAFGANKVFITDVNPNRLRLAKQLGADGTYLIDVNSFDEQAFANRIKQDMGVAPDVSLECSGSTASTAMAMYATKPGGRVGIVAIGIDKMSVPLVYASIREIDIIGVCRFKDDFPLAIQLVSSGKVNVKPLITHKFSIENAIEAFELMKSGTADSLKIMIQY